jgi:hypothetical protein
MKNKKGVYINLSKNKKTSLRSEVFFMMYNGMSALSNF